MFGKFLVEPDALFLAGTNWVAAKVLIAAFGIAVVAYFKGAEPKDSPEDVARAEEILLKLGLGNQAANG